MGFEWDDKKNRANIEKHGVSFKTAARIFDGLVLTAEDDRFEYGEVRKNSIGMIENALILVVTHTDRAGKTRINSARPGSRAERSRYEQALQQGTKPQGTVGD